MGRGGGFKLTACGLGKLWTLIMCRVRLFLRMNCSVHKEHCQKKGDKGIIVCRVLLLCVAVVVGATLVVVPHLVRHLSGVRDEVQAQLLLAIERGGARRARVPLLVQTAHTRVW